MTKQNQHLKRAGDLLSRVAKIYKERRSEESKELAEEYVQYAQVEALLGIGEELNQLNAAMETMTCNRKQDTA